MAKIDGNRRVKTGGRQKGSKNKIPADLKEAILEAAKLAGEELGQKGMIGYLQVQAIKNPAPFMSLLGRVLPMTVAGTGEGGAITVHVNRGV